MQIKCEYCDYYIKETDKTCPRCGAVNSNYKRTADGTPKTINELKVWYKEKNLPDKEVTRFFIGEDYKGARAFGIYEENGEFIVYKNKDDGSRAIRYKGDDEAYAVNEIYLKLKSEILNQKAHNINKKSGVADTNGSSSLFGKMQVLFSCITLLVVMIFTISVFFASVSDYFKYSKDKPYAGNYYLYDGYMYYCESYVDDDWYYYDYDDRDYVPCYLPEEMYENINEYKYADDEEWDESIERFEDTETGQYVKSLHESSDSDSDSDYSWDSSDSWNSSDTDWGSDW